jgi:hypothetical protein
MIAVEQKLVNAFVHLGLTENQEHKVSDLVSDVMKQQQELLDNSEETDRVLKDLGERLGQLGLGAAKNP